jgi:hypothetical protein
VLDSDSSYRITCYSAVLPFGTLADNPALHDLDEKTMNAHHSTDLSGRASAFLSSASSRFGWRPSLSEKLRSLWLGLLLLAIVAAGFSLSYFAYARLASHGSGSSLSVETHGD